MRKLSYCILLAVMASCSNKETEVTYEFIIKEYKSGSPVSQASLQLFNCVDYDVLYGCQQTGVIATYYTDNSGVSIVSERDYNLASQGVVISKSGYWNQDVTPGIHEINKEGSIQLQVTKTGNYPSGAWFMVFNKDERNRMNKMVYYMAVPGDANTIVKGYANQNNNLSWAVSSDPLGLIHLASGTIPAFHVTEGVTASASITY